MSPMPDQPQTVKYCHRNLVHPTPQQLIPVITIQSLEAKAEREVSVSLSSETQKQPEARPDETPERKDSAVFLPVSDSVPSESFERPAETELCIALQSSEQTPNHFYSLSWLEAGLGYETSRMMSMWGRFFG
jgi:hypothetical protein